MKLDKTLSIGTLALSLTFGALAVGSSAQAASADGQSPLSVTKGLQAGCGGGGCGAGSCGAVDDKKDADKKDKDKKDADKKDTDKTGADKGTDSQCGANSCG